MVFASIWDGVEYARFVWLIAFRTGLSILTSSKCTRVIPSDPNAGLVEPLITVITSYAFGLAGFDTNRTGQFWSPRAWVGLNATTKKNAYIVEGTLSFYGNAKLASLGFKQCKLLNQPFKTWN